MRRSTILALFTCALALAGCATTVVSNDQTAPGTILDAKATTPRAGTGIVTIKRDAGFFGMGCVHRLSLDGRPFAELRTKEAVVLYPEPGAHVLSVEATLLCWDTSEVAFTIASGQRLTFRSGVAAGGGIRIQATAF